MNIELVPVNHHVPMHLAVLHQLLSEREPWQAISHKEMPTWEQHVAFVRSEPYKGWYMIVSGGRFVGSTYFSKQNEIGIFILKEFVGQGYAKPAVLELMQLHEGPHYANINPANPYSIAFFEKLGFKLLQVTYVQE